MNSNAMLYRFFDFNVGDGIANSNEFLALIGADLDFERLNQMSGRHFNAFPRATEYLRIAK